MKLTLEVWRQKDEQDKGHFETYQANDVSPEMSFLEMLDVVNESLITTGKQPIAFDHDCREGICGSCDLMINGLAHGPGRGVTSCQVHMRQFKDGDTIVIEPWRAKPFPVIKDLIVNRNAFDRIIQAGGFVTVATGSAPDANSTPVAKRDADHAFDGAACIGCGACVAACPNGSAMLFTAAKIGHLAQLPQGQSERYDRVIRMVDQMDEEGFGGCTNIGECSAVCPKEISMDFIARMNRDLVVASVKGRGRKSDGGGVG